MAEPTTTSNCIETTATSQVPVGKLPTRAQRVHAARGKFSWVPFSSDDHVDEKQEEIQQEERRR
jgi:hypothetical protein